MNRIKSSNLKLLLLLVLFLLFFLPVLLIPEKPTSSNLLKHLQGNLQQYEQASSDNKISFPEAHWPHKTYRHEWWYLTANLTATNGQHFASQWTLFRTSINNHHWYFAHAALADTQVHLSEFRDAREELGNINIINKPFSAVIDDWSWLSSAQLFPAQLEYGSAQDGQTDVNAAQREWQARLALSTDKPFYLQGLQGFSKKHDSKNIASHYYSHPFIDVKGEIYWQGKWLQVTGNAWFDREWGSAMLAEDQQGWDWFSLRLAKDTALMIYRIRSQQENFLYGSVMSNNGKITTLAKTDIQLTSVKPDAGSYPQRFNIKVAKQGIDISVHIINEQQIMRFGIEYFEGMVNFDGSHKGQGFIEMTGYN